MTSLHRCGEVVRDRDQIRDALLAAFHDVIERTSAADSDEMAARTLIDVVAYVISFKVPDTVLDHGTAINAFTRNETLRFEMYLREHLLRRAQNEPVIITDGENVPTQPVDDNGGV